ncbi:hypothetical protein [Pseudomonas sp. MGal98]
MSILIGLASELVFNAAMATQLVFQQPVNAYLEYGHCLPSGA